MVLLFYTVMEVYTNFRTVSILLLLLKYLIVHAWVIHFLLVYPISYICSGKECSYLSQAFFNYFINCFYLRIVLIIMLQHFNVSCSPIQ